MTTVADLIDRVKDQLHGYGLVRDVQAPLTAGVDAADLAWSVDVSGPWAVALGPAEVGSEQVMIVANSSGSLTVQRALNGTTPDSHDAGDILTSRPRITRKTIFDRLNETIDDLHPQIFAVNTWLTSVRAPQNTYTLPAPARGQTDPVQVVDVQWQDPIGDWHRAQSYTTDPYDQTFRLGDRPPPGWPLRIMYSVAPSRAAAETDQLADLGIPESCADVLVLGAVARVLPGLEIVKADPVTVDQQNRSQNVQPQTGLNAAKFVMAQYQQRLAAEAASLRKRYRARVVKVW